VLSISDLTARTAKNRRRARRVDPTSVTFPFKPGDYVVHATHASRSSPTSCARRWQGASVDYFLLEYAGEDKLYVPLEQVDRITRYIGPDGGVPRLTRLNTADWSRATGKARRSAKKLAFDLVDLYTRRASVSGYAFSTDTPVQQEMEANFSYELTPDQANAVTDIKADMESRKPMDRLLCGDVGFGKTRGRPAGGVQVLPGRQAGHGPLSHDHPRRAALRDVLLEVRALRPQGGRPFPFRHAGTAAQDPRGLADGSGQRPHRHQPPALGRRQSL